MPIVEAWEKFVEWVTRVLRRILGRRWGILFRTLLLTWIVVLSTLGVFIVNIVPYQNRALVENIESSARLIAASIDQVTVMSILVEDYSAVVDHCMKVVDESSLVAYIVVSKNEGFSLVHGPDGWRYESLEGFWLPQDEQAGQGVFAEDVLNTERSFHYFHRLNYSGIDWGWIHVGLTVDQFLEDRKILFWRTLGAALVSVVVGGGISFVFARRFTRPIQKLNEVTQKIAMGDLSARTDVRTGDELEALAQSFDTMTTALHTSYEELEGRVAERTSDLADANEQLKSQIAERERAEQQIKKSLEEKEVLLKEIHHRVKNNLQVISSLLYLQSRHILEPELLAHFMESQNRVKSMALIHERLYRTEDFTNIDFKEYIRALTDHLMNAYRTERGTVRLRIEVDDVKLGIDAAIPCGLMINELVSNALKYAFPEGSSRIEEGSAVIRVALHSRGEDRADDVRPHELVVEDNGVGLPGDFDFRRSESLGLQLVSSLTQQLGGSVELRRDGGTAFVISFDA